MTPDPTRDPTVIDVAQAAGVSVSTAAAALRNARSVKATTRDHVCAIADRLGYRRNSAASVLATRRSFRKKTISLAYLTFHATDRPPTDYALTTPRELARLCAEREWVFAHHDIGELSEAPALARDLEARGVDIAILGSSARTHLHAVFPWHRFVCLSDQRDRVNDGFDVVRSNEFGAVESILHGLSKAGYRRIGFFHLHHDQPLQPDLSRLAGSLVYNEVVPPERRASLFKARFSDAIDSDPVIVAGLRRWLDETDPDVVVGTNRYTRRAINLVDGQDRPGKPPRPFLSLIVPATDGGQTAGLLDGRTTVAPILLNRALEKLRLGQLGLTSNPLETVFWNDFIPGQSLLAPGGIIPLILPGRMHAQ